MRSCAGAILLLSLLRVADPQDNVSCKHLIKGRDEWTGQVGDRFCYKRMPKQLVTRLKADEMCKNEGATLPQLYETSEDPEGALIMLIAFVELCWEGNEDKGTYWLDLEKRGDKWVWGDGRQSKFEGSKDAKYSVYNKQARSLLGPIEQMTGAMEAKSEGELANTCCQHKLNGPLTKAPPSTTVPTTQHYTPTRTQKDTPSKPIIVYTRPPKPHQPPSTTTHRPVTTKPGGNLGPKGTAGGMSSTLLLIVVFLGGAMLVAALIVVCIYLAHSKKKRRRRHHHGRRHAEPPSTTARTNPRTSAF